MSRVRTPVIICLILSLLYLSEARKGIHWIPLSKSSAPDDNCVCFPEAEEQTPIWKMVNPDTHSTERLVVYLYRNPITKDVILYTPDIKKQQLIPDLSYNTGDIIQVNSKETFAGLFSTNPNVVERNVNIPHESNENDIPIESNVTNIPEVQSNLGNIPMAPDSNVEGSVEQDDQDDNSITPQDEVVQTEQSVPGNPGVDIIDDSWKPDQWQLGSNDLSLNGTFHDYHGNVDVHDFITFDKWFEVQMSLFINMPGPINSNTINVVTLKSLIEKTLQENNIYVSSTGMLVDAKGMAFDVSNLRLRPILIGNLLVYEKILRNTHQFTLPTNSPYLEALLVSLSTPPKVLGIIPLGITVLPKSLTYKHISGVQDVNSSGTNTLHDESTPPANTIQHAGTSGMNTPHHDAILGVNTDQHVSSSEAKHEEPTTHQTAPIKTRRIIPGRVNTTAKIESLSSKTRRKQSVKDNNKSGGTEKKISDNKSKAEPIDGFQVQNILQKVFEIITPPHSLFPKPSHSRIGIAGTSNEDYDYTIWHKYEDDDEPDFRIIGGNSATGSGTPLNNKGRSSADYM